MKFLKKILRLLGGLLLILLLLLGGITGWLLASESGLRWAWAQAAHVLDDHLQAGAVSGRLIGPLQIHDLQWQQDDTRISISELELDWLPRHLLDGELALRAVRVAGTRIELAAAGKDAAAEESSASLPESILLPLELSIDALHIEQLELQLGDKEFAVLDSLLLRASWKGHELQLHPLQAQGFWGQLTLEGQLATGGGMTSDLALKWALTVTPELAGDVLQDTLPVSGTAHLGGSFSKPELRLELAEPAMLTAAASAAWQESPLAWQVEFSLPDLDPSTLQQAWPALSFSTHGEANGLGEEISLQLEGAFSEVQAGEWNYSLAAGLDGRLARLQQLQLIPVEGKGSIHLQADWPLDGSDATAHLQWTDLLHPLLQGWQASGHLQWQGVPDWYTGNLGLRTAHETLPAIEVKSDFSGSTKNIHLAGLEGRGLDGHLQGSAHADWSQALSWQGDLQFADLALVQFDPRLPETVSGAMQVSGSLAGTLQLELQQVRVQTGSAQLQARGELVESWNIDWKLDIPDATQIWKEAAGSVHLAGQVDGPQQTPRLRVRGDAKKLAWADWSLAATALHADIDLAGKQPWRADLQLEGLAQGAYQLDSARLVARGGPEEHRIRFSASGMDSRLELAASGAWDGEGWSGLLRDGELEVPYLGNWKSSASRLQWRDASGSLQAWCWRGQGEICVDLGTREAHWDSSIAVAELPLDLLQPLMPQEELAVSGRLGGVIVASGEGAAVQNLIGRLGTGDARLQYRLPEEVVTADLQTFDLQLDGNQQGLRVLWQAASPDGHSELQIALPGWMPGMALDEDQALQGHFELQARELSWLSFIEPNLLQPAGQLHSRLELAGTLGEPMLNGNLDLQDGEVQVPAAGIHIKEISLEGRSRNGRFLRLQGKAKSGEGWLDLDGRLLARRLDRWRMTVTLKGENFEVAKRVQARAQVTPDLELTLDAGGLRDQGVAGVINLKGSLTVPIADISLPEISTSVDVSADEIFLDEEVEEEEKGGRWLTALDLDFILSERVRLEGYGFSARLAGKLNFRGESVDKLRARGEINIHDGRYQAYGQNLRVERGRLLFADGPPDNPSLDVRAVRPLLDHDQTVGVEVSGRLKNPRLRIFSEPALEETDALSWLILGRPLNTASGNDSDALYRAAVMMGGSRAARGIAMKFGLDEVGIEQGAGSEEAAMVVGKYLTPRLYLQYAVGIWEAANRLRLRYTISRRWTLKLEQGGPHSGGDFQYVIER